MPLDAHQLPEYPGLAHAVSPPSFRSLSKTKTTGRRGMSHQTRWSTTHYNVTRASARLSLDRLSDETYRRKIARQLNKGENLHALRRDLFYASEGAIRHHNPEQQTEQAWGLEQQWNGQWR